LTISSDVRGVELREMLAHDVLPDGTLLLTGVDLNNAESALRIIERSLAFGLIPGLVLAIGFGLVAGRRAATQVDAVRGLTKRTVAGDLDQRLPVGERPDSFRLLCAHIDLMLDRIQSLVIEVRGVGDDIAHQLRTPLTRLRARLERGLREASDVAAFQASADAALDEIDQLLGIVTALLRVRELEDHARRSRFAPVDLARLAEEAWELHRPTAEDGGIVLSCDINPVAPIDGDASLLIEAMSNLIDNAMKFGPAGGNVTLLLQQEHGAVVITVTDQGAGVPAAERPLVTQRFYRGRHGLEGAGLGLSLSRRSPICTASHCASPRRAARSRSSGPDDPGAYKPIASRSVIVRGRTGTVCVVVSSVKGLPKPKLLPRLSSRLATSIDQCRAPASSDAPVSSVA